MSNSKKQNSKQGNKNNNSVKKAVNSKKNNNNKSTGNVKNKKDLEKTGKIDLVFDDERLEKTELLDISFIDSSNEKKDKSKTDKIEVLTEEDEKLFKSNNNIRNGFITCLVILLAFVLGFSVAALVINSKVEVKTKLEKEITYKNDENIVFVGDSLFDGYDVEESFKGRHVVNSGISGNKTTDILADMEQRIYRYNPSTVFLLIGTNDFCDDELTKEDTVLNIGKIIDEIKENRPYAEINVISLLPVNKTDDEKISASMVANRNNKEIKEVNRGVKVLCEEKKVTFVDMFSLLVDEEGNMKIDYTTEGLHLTDEGYAVITKELMKYLEEDKK